jgi:hypothetical protein
MAQTDTATVRKQIVVDTPIERAFSVFTGRFGDFKPPEHNLLGREAASGSRSPPASSARGGTSSSTGPSAWSSRGAGPTRASGCGRAAPGSR